VAAFLSRLGGALSNSTFGQNLGKTWAKLGYFSGVLRLVDRHVFILGPLAHVSCLSVFPERFCLQTAGMHD
jgi:hypothetical protein